jgi:anhydro-N-acetylmuramic acid kinase
VKAAYFAGLMSGTSLDGVDAVLADFSAPAPRVLCAVHLPFDPALRAELLALNSPGPDEVGRAALAGNALARRYAEALGRLFAQAGVGADAVRAAGCHGQTIRHRPERGYTVQIGNAALVAELSGVTVVADFRSRDVAAGGQGAPLAPAFHAAVFRDEAEARAVLNVGGIANVTRLPARGPVSGFDCGPGNCLLDLWAQRHLGRPLDQDGAWAAGGRVDDALLARFLDEPYFRAAPPKSTGRDLFNAGWLDSRLKGEPAQDVQATLLELTARSAARACEGAARIIVCGGGAANGALMRRLAALAAPAAVAPSDRHGVPPTQVEALAFAWLARQALEGEAVDVSTVTGARGARVLGAIYRA